MKQAILITAYKDTNSLIDIINLLGNQFNFYIHIDKKAKLDFSKLCNIENVFVTNKYKVNWGGLNHLKAILLLASKALQDSNNSFFHLITGEDFPIKTMKDFHNLDISKNYLEYFEMPATCWTDDGGFGRINYYHLHDIFNAKKPVTNVFIIGSLYFQKMIKLKRKLPHRFFEDFYGGSTYWSLSRDALQYVIDYTITNNDFLKRLNFTFCAEEIYFQTIILNSIHASNIINDNLRYIDWSLAKGGSPGFLDDNHFDSIILSDKFFARKVKASEKLKFMLTKYLQNRTNVRD